MKLPWAKFFWDDFERDTSMLDNDVVGCWIRLLCKMSRAPRRGYLLHATGHPFSDSDAAKALHLSDDAWLAVRTELLRTGVASQDKHGTLFNRRQVREAEEHAEDRLRKAKANQKQPKSLSNQRNFPDGFQEFSAEIPPEKPEARSQKREGDYPPSSRSSPRSKFASCSAAVAAELVQGQWRNSDPAQVERELTLILETSVCPERDIETIRLHARMYRVYYQQATKKDRDASKPIQWWLKDKQWMFPPAAVMPEASEGVYVP